MVLLTEIKNQSLSLEVTWDQEVTKSLCGRFFPSQACVVSESFMLIYVS